MVVVNQSINNLVVCVFLFFVFVVYHSINIFFVCVFFFYLIYILTCIANIYIDLMTNRTVTCA